MKNMNMVWGKVDIWVKEIKGSQLCNLYINIGIVITTIMKPTGRKMMFLMGAQN